MDILHIGQHAAATPDKPAVILAETGEEISFKTLNERSIRVARLLHTHGLRQGDHIALMMENNAACYEICWAARRSGLYFTPINWHLSADEAAYIVRDCGAKAFFTSAAVANTARQLSDDIADVGLRFMLGGTIEGYQSYEDAVAQADSTPLPKETEGAYMFYSSGTTGRPKGILRPQPEMPFGTATNLDTLMTGFFGFSADTIYLCPAPLYHAAPLGWSMATQRFGGTVILMAHFDAEEALRLIERHRITHAQFVPTMFVRMLKLEPDIRGKYDLSSLQTVIHAAAPCPVEVKQQMIEWWGPIIYEYYAGSEGNGFTTIGPEDWLAHPGSVGRAVSGTIHIVGEDGEDVPAGEVGSVYFANTAVFEYHNDPAKTAEAYNAKGWSTLGDMGYLDDEGFLYLTDRKSHMIISGGVNIYPQEVENILALHPDILDVAVIGVPNPEFGEEVKAVVQPKDPARATSETAEAIIAYCRDRLAHFKCPRSVDFTEELPRLPNGKLLKRVLRDQYWPKEAKVRI